MVAMGAPSWAPAHQTLRAQIRRRRICIPRLARSPHSRPEGLAVKTHLRENVASNSTRRKADTIAARIRARPRYFRPTTSAANRMLAEHRQRKEGGR